MMIAPDLNAFTLAAWALQGTGNLGLTVWDRASQLDPHLAPTGKQVAVAGIAIYQITGGRIEEVWVASDSLGMMQQLGAVPAPGQGGS